ncbi:hypothetical protein [Fusibacter sp. JL216-2]|uniref:hypothetical protein n=1 Tax=Fusibacter sp. JL216-2 TaxID=3071453 RepID=UPI003D349F04
MKYFKLKHFKSRHCKSCIIAILFTLIIVNSNIASYSLNDSDSASGIHEPNSVSLVQLELNNGQPYSLTNTYSFAVVNDVVKPEVKKLQINYIFENNSETIGEFALLPPASYPNLEGPVNKYSCYHLNTPEENTAIIVYLESSKWYGIIKYTLNDKSIEKQQFYVDKNNQENFGNSDLLAYLDFVTEDITEKTFASVETPQNKKHPGSPAVLFVFMQILLL